MAFKRQIDTARRSIAVVTSEPLLLSSVATDSQAQMTAHTHGRLHQKTAIKVALAVMLAVVVHAGHVDLYRDANFKHKLLKVKSVQTDTCYNLGCFGLDDVVTSAKWGELPKTTNKGETSQIAFYTDRGCDSKGKMWTVKVESDAEPNFPADFQLDGLKNSVSAFMAINTAEVQNQEHVCPESASAGAAKETFNISFETDGSAAANNTAA